MHVSNGVLTRLSPSRDVCVSLLQIMHTCVTLCVSLLLPNSHVVVGSQTQSHVSSVFRLYNSRPNSWVCGDKETTMGATHDTPAKYTLERWSLISQSNLAVSRVLLLLQHDPRTLQCFPHHWLTWCNQTKRVCVCVHTHSYGNVDWIKWWGIMLYYFLIFATSIKVLTSLCMVPLTWLFSGRRDSFFCY